MNPDQKVATVFGGTGFIGRHVVRLLAKSGYTVKVATRTPESAYFLRVCGSVGQVVPLACDYADPESVRQAVRGARHVVNCIGILHERRRGAFKRAHVEIPAAIAAACAAERVERLVHISALGIDASKSRYARTKREGEDAVRKAFPAATILRPSVVFGPEDRFFNMFAELARYMPVLPLIGGGRTKFQPVYVGDVASAVMAALTLPAHSGGSPCGKVYELGGPDVVTFGEIYERLFDFTGRRRALMTLPWGLAKVQSCFLSVLPNPLLTPDQVTSLKTDSIVSPGAATLADLGIHVSSMAMVLPGYLARFRSGGRAADKKRA